MKQRKAELIKVRVENYRELAAGWGEGREYASWMNSPINNARLETVADYNAWVPVMSHYLQQHGINRFQEEMQRLANLSLDDRNEGLSAMPTAAGNTSR